MIHGEVEIRHFHLFCGLGGGGKGFNRGRVTVNGVTGAWRCIGGIDIDPAAIRDFEMMTGAKGTVLDLMSREQYVDFHGHKPPKEWREVIPEDVLMAASYLYPDVVFLSAPCKGFSGLLSEKKSLSTKYQALNALTLRGIWLTMEGFKNNLPKLVIFENVPRIATRGRKLLDRIGSLLRSYGYAIAETTHDCGELGGLAQSRKRFLLVARLESKVAPFLYVPKKHSLRPVGEVLEKLPSPGDPVAGPLHRVPSLMWETWVRLAFVEAGSDWRSLNRLRVKDGVLQDYLIIPEHGFRGGDYEVTPWSNPAKTVTSKNSPTSGPHAVADPRVGSYYNHGVLGVRTHSGAFCIADPRFNGTDYRQYGIRSMNEPTGVIAGQQAPGQGGYAVADPRLDGIRHSNIYRVVHFEEYSASVTAGGGPTAGGLCIADPRPHESRLGYKKYRVTDFKEPSFTVISGSTTGQGAYAVADPRPGMAIGREHYLTGGHFGVLRMDESSGAVTGHAKHDNGPWNVADHRLPKRSDKLTCMIIAEDGTWHRPFTTLELAALQSLLDPEKHFHKNPDGTWTCIKPFDLDGVSDSAKRERIGNAVPPAAAEAIAREMARTLILAANGETFSLSADAIWVKPAHFGNIEGIIR